MADSFDSGEKRKSKSQLPARSLSFCARFESSAATFPSSTTFHHFTRSFSLGRIPEPNPRRNNSLSYLSRDSSRRSFAGVPGEEIAQIGDVGDRILDGTLENRRESWRKGSIKLPHDLEHGVLGDEENRLSAQIGDSGDQVLGENEEGLLLEQDTLTISEKGVAPFEDCGLSSNSILYSNEEKISTLTVQPLEVQFFDYLGLVDIS